MIKVITYGSFDLLHYGHKRLLERAKALGDYLIVGVTSDDYDQIRGKVNAQQPVMERVEAVRALGIADEILIEEYDGQKIDDIIRLNIDIFAIGSDWRGKFDYLEQYCKVIYLERTEGISSSELRAEERHIRLGIIGSGSIPFKVVTESRFVNGLEISAVCTSDSDLSGKVEAMGGQRYNNLAEMMDNCDAVYVVSHPTRHYDDSLSVLKAGKHVICEEPLAMNEKECLEQYRFAEENGLILFEAIKTAYATAFHRLLLLAKIGAIGKILSVDATCSSLADLHGTKPEELLVKWGAFDAWGPTALLPVFDILGINYAKCNVTVKFLDEKQTFDGFVKMDFLYPDAVASVKVGKMMKSEGSLIVSGTNGYIYVPAPWWKPDYFEVRRENQNENKRYFYQLEGEGIRQMLVAFLKSIQNSRKMSLIGKELSLAMVKCRECVTKSGFILA